VRAAPALTGFDHVHVMVRDRSAALAWYHDVLGMTPVAELAAWQADGGPLTLADAGGSVHIALFERAPEARNPAVVALATSAPMFVRWRDHLAGVLGRGVEVVDHDLSLSLYLRDPDGNPYEITTYEHAAARAALHAAH
jgi:catechol 2,3-dioxygenase-like lactoylglutathione lyase family enzyme